ncbi:MAG: hypothetical protein WCQ26_02060 [Pseudanabaena sp. ELA748]
MYWIWADFAFGYELGDRFLLFVLVSSDRADETEPYIEHYFKSENNDIWQFPICDRMEQTMKLHSLNTDIPLTEIYRRIAGIQEK